MEHLVKLVLLEMIANVVGQVDRRPVLFPSYCLAELHFSMSTRQVLHLLHRLLIRTVRLIGRTLPRISSPTAHARRANSSTHPHRCFHTLELRCRCRFDTGV